MLGWNPEVPPQHFSYSVKKEHKGQTSCRIYLQTNPKGGVLMLYKDCIEELTGLKDLIIEKVQNVYGETHIYGHMAKRIHSCPRCGSNTSKVHDYHKQVIRDVDMSGQRTYIHLRKRRHVCPTCHKRFYEKVSFLPRYHRMTKRLYSSIVQDFSHVQSMVQIARIRNVSVTTVAHLFDVVSYGKPKLPKVLSIDEFRGNAGGEKFQCLLTDPTRKIPLDVLPTRKTEDLYAYFSSCEGKEHVEYVVMDMSNLFRSVAKTCFPQAHIVADRFHVVRQVCWAFENVRKEEQKKFAAGRRRYFKRSRTLMLKHFKDLTPEERERLNPILHTSERMRQAYAALQDFYELMEEPTRERARKHIGQWMFLVEGCDLPEFTPCLTAIRNWTQEILNIFDVPYTNGFTEGCNNKIKVLKRVSYGVQNFSRFRNRILFAMNA